MAVVSERQRLKFETEEVQAIISELEPYKTPEGSYDIKKADLGAVSSAIGAGLFTREQFDSARSTGKPLYFTEPEKIKEARVEYEELETLTGDARIAKARDIDVLPKGFDELPPELKTAYGVSDTAFNIAVDKYNEEQEAEVAKVEAVSIKLDTGEFVDKVAFGELAEDKQALLRKVGVDQFNVIQKKEARVEIEKTILLPNTNERLNRAEFNDLSKTDQALIMDIGIDKFNTQKKAEVTTFERDNRKLATGEYIPFTDWNILTTSQQAYLNMRGIDKFNKWETGKAEKPIEAAATMVEVDTPVGIVTMPQSEWDKMPEMKQFEVALNRPLTVEEWVAYRLDQRGIKTPWYGMFPGISQIIASAQTYIPGDQAGEVALQARLDAQREWYLQYPELKGHGIVESTFTDLGFPAIKSIYPTITVNDVTGKEYAVSALSAAMWSLPIWGPKLVAAVKLPVSIKTPILKFQVPIKKIQVGFGNTKLTFKTPIKVSWGAGLQRAGVPAIVEKLALQSGKAAQRLKLITTRHTIITKVGLRKGVLLPQKVVTNIKTAQLSSRAADIKFINSLAGLRLSTKQLKLIGEVTGYKNLPKLILAVQKAQVKLSNAWTRLDKFKVGTPEYIRALSGVTKAKRGAYNMDTGKFLPDTFVHTPGGVAKARIELGIAVDKLDDVLRPRYTQPPPAPRFDGYKMKWNEQAGNYLPDSPAPIKTAFEAKYGSKTPLPPDVYQRNYKAMIDSWHPATAPDYILPKGGVITAPAAQATLTGLEQLYKMPTLSVLKTSPIYATQLAPQFVSAGLPAYSAASSFAMVAPPIPMTIAAEVAIEAPLPTVIPATKTNILTAVMVKLNITQEQLTGVKPLTATQIDTITEVSTKTMTEVVAAAKVGTLTSILIEPKVAEALDLKVGLAIPATEVETDIALKTATAIAVKAMTDVLVKGATATEVQLAGKTALKATTLTATQVAEALAIATTTATAVTPTTPAIITPVIPWLDQPSPFDKKKQKILPGTIAWRQGIFWIMIPPPYNKRYYSKEPPAGVYKFAVGEDSPYKTIQAIGGMPSKDVTGIDIGIAIVDIIRKGKQLEIHFKQDVDDAYKGKTVKEKVTVIRPPSAGKMGIPAYTVGDDGRIILTEKPKKPLKPRPPQQIPVRDLSFDEPEPAPKRKKVEKVEPVAGRYYFGHRLPEANVRVEL